MVPENIISDNFKTFKSKEVRNFMRYLRVKWIFILEKSLWLVGFYEGMVRILKNALKKVVGRISLDRDQLNTVLIKIENKSLILVHLRIYLKNILKKV